MLRNHPWFGNVRELRYCMQRLRVTCPARLDARPSRPRHPSTPGRTWPSGPMPHADQEKTDERSRIRAALEACHGHQISAARPLRISRSTPFRKMRNLGLRCNQTPLRQQ